MLDEMSNFHVFAADGDSNRGQVDFYQINISSSKGYLSLTAWGLENKLDLVYMY